MSSHFLSVGSVLKTARDLVQTGWCQNAYEMEGRDLVKRFDILGALEAGAQGQPYRVYNSARFAVVEAILEANFDGEYVGDDVIVDWNDDPKRTQEEVVAMFNRAIEYVVKAEKEGVPF